MCNLYKFRYALSEVIILINLEDSSFLPFQIPVGTSEKVTCQRWFSPATPVSPTTYTGIVTNKPQYVTKIKILNSQLSNCTRRATGFHDTY